MVKTRAARYAAVGVAVALAAAACGGSDSGGSGKDKGTGTGTGKTAAGGKGGTLNILMSADFEHLDPARIYVVDSSDFSRLYARTLTTFATAPGKAGQKVIPDLATDLGTPSNGNKTWKFTLKDGLKYQDGTPITSADLKYGVERSFADNLPEGAPYARQFLACKGYKGPYTDTKGCSAIQTPDSKTIIFNFNQPFGEFSYAAALPTFSPVPKAKDKGVNYDNLPFSSGPYMFQSYQRGKSITLVRNKNWSKSTDTARKALPDKIQVTQGVEPTVIDQRLISDAGPDQTAIQLDVSVAPENIAKVLTNPQVKARSIAGPSNCNRYLGLNTKRGPMKNLKVRQALQYAVNKETYRTARGGASAGTFATTIIPPTLAGYKKFDLYPAPPAGDVAKAKALLKEAGYPNGFKATLKTTNAGKGVTTATAVQEALARVGIKVNVDQVDGSVYYTEIGDTAKEPEMVFYGWCPDWPSASTVLPVLFDGRNIVPQGNNNISQYNNPAVNAKLDAVAKLPAAQQAQEYGNIDELAMKDAPIVPLLDDRVVILHGSKVKGAYLMQALGGVIDVSAVSVS